jgi:hypothetical protein
MQENFSSLLKLLRQKYKTDEEAESIYNAVREHTYLSKFLVSNVQSSEESSINVMLQLCRNMRHEHFAKVI